MPKLPPKIDLCLPCTTVLQDEFILKRVAGGIDNKITCARCRRRRYGATYEIEKRKEPLWRF